MPPPKTQLPEGGKTLVYSTVDGHDIKLDYYLPRNTTSGHLPAIIYYHGGGMTAGSRRDGHFPTWLYGARPSLSSSIPPINSTNP
ncbi:hypothetical protein BO82DRAFT_20735 [Aspergillus uvarum CBS 121591]|uniref:Carboxylesterase type B domain-containing protein n=1 Tax=Aspergillus uvarum CBS 121591 TaxID=1448315 RepID=A0A319BSU1_9EURO|nr:hypothetical protein BO82DRAFT_20735 [Aspergillus uvarum CBS 121591]PYH75541.1 hypothetical protein BO82DRAFT_20735 [Aspergillus uvarum CBS 121591]